MHKDGVVTECSLYVKPVHRRVNINLAKIIYVILNVPALRAHLREKLCGNGIVELTAFNSMNRNQTMMDYCYCMSLLYVTIPTSAESAI